MSSILCLADLPSNEEFMSSAIELRPYQPGDAEAFRELNEAWIKRHFGLEEHDNEMLGNPEGYVLSSGGHIFFAVADGKHVGCCALLPMSPDVYEVAKMAVAES